MDRRNGRYREERDSGSFLWGCGKGLSPKKLTPKLDFEKVFARQ